MKLLKNRAPLLTAAALVLCATFTAVFTVRHAAQTDTDAPVIRMDSELVSVSVTDTDEQLLQGVTAWDEQDGDVTAGMVVESLSALTAQHTATATVAAFDSAGNVAKAVRTVQFTDYTSPRFGQTQALIFRANSSPDLLHYLTAEDRIDGSLDKRIKGTLISDTGNLNQPGMHEVEFRVTNSMGDTVKLTLPVEIYNASSYNASVTLTEYLTYLQVGNTFAAESYLDTLTAGGYEYPLTEPDPALDYIVSVDRYMNPANYSRTIINVTVDGTVDTTQPGVYSVGYTIDLGGRYTAHTRLNVVVEG